MGLPHVIEKIKEGTLPEPIDTTEEHPNTQLPPQFIHAAFLLLDETCEETEDKLEEELEITE